MIPPPTPTSPDRKITSSVPAAAPRRCSARAPRSASLATTTGAVAERPREGAIPAATSRQPRLGAVETNPSWRRTTPTTATPMPTRASCRQWSATPSASSTRSATMSSGVDVAARPLDARRARRRDHPARRPPWPASRRRSPGPARRRGRDRGARAGTADRASPSDSPRSSTTRPAVDEVADESADAAARQPGALAELRARQRPVGVQRLHERAEVGPPDRLAALPAVPCHGICASRAQNVGDRLPHGPVGVKGALRRRSSSGGRARRRRGHWWRRGDR